MPSYLHQCRQMFSAQYKQLPLSPRIFGVLWSCAGLLISAIGWAGEQQEPDGQGEVVYRKLCADCHGDKGEGVEGVHDGPLIGILTPAELARYITQTMPEESPEDCVGEEAKAVADYVFREFYSIEAQNRRNPPKRLFSRLTTQQYRNAVADLVSSFIDRREPRSNQFGLNATYYSSRNQSNRNKVEQKTDALIDIDYQGESPEKVKGKEFSVAWTGALVAEETGEYEIVVRSSNSVRLNLNGSRKRLIDANVVSGESAEFRAKIFLLEGRAYDLQILWSRHKEKKAFINLSWTPPGGELTTIPAQNFRTRRMRPLIIPSASFPADDESYGYPRGISVSSEWLDANSRSAIEIGQKIARNLNVFARAGNPAEQRTKAQEFCEQFARKAFCGRLTDHQKDQYVDRIFSMKDLDAADATKRSVVRVLTSPYFLYPHLQGTDPATQLALVFWDSIPDQTLLDAGKRNLLKDNNSVDWRLAKMLEDDRARIKLNQFFDHWFHLDDLKNLPKDTSAKGFDQELVNDLRTSFRLQIEHVLWSERSDLREFFSSKDWYANRRLAEFYGVEYPADQHGFQKLTRAGGKTGMFTHPLLMSGFAYPSSSSPIHRGVFLVRNILGRRLNPPPDVFPPFDGEIARTWTTREKVTHQTKPVNCQRCHGLINQLGFAMEHFDTLGRVRLKDNQKQIDSSGQFQLADGEPVKFGNSDELLRELVKGREVTDHFVEELFQFMVKQPVAAFGVDTKSKLRDSFVNNGYNIKKLLVEIGKVAAFAETTSGPATSRKSEKGTGQKTPSPANAAGKN